MFDVNEEKLRNLKKAGKSAYLRYIFYQIFLVLMTFLV